MSERKKNFYLKNNKFESKITVSRNCNGGNCRGVRGRNFVIFHLISKNKIILITDAHFFLMNFNKFQLLAPIFGRGVTPDPGGQEL